MCVRLSLACCRPRGATWNTVCCTKSCLLCWAAVGAGVRASPSQTRLTVQADDDWRLQRPNTASSWTPRSPSWDWPQSTCRRLPVQPSPEWVAVSSESTVFIQPVSSGWSVSRVRSSSSLSPVADQSPELGHHPALPTCVLILLLMYIYAKLYPLAPPLLLLPITIVRI